MNIRQTVNCARLLCLRSLVTCWTIGFAVVVAQGAEGKWSGTSEVAYVTDYLWRGHKLAGDSLQPSISTTYSDKLTLGMWGSYGLKKDSPADPSGKGKYGETDFIGTYAFSQD